MFKTKKNVLVILMVMILSCSMIFAAGISEQKEDSVNAYITDIEGVNGSYTISVKTDNSQTLNLVATDKTTSFYNNLSDLKAGNYIEYIADDNGNASYIRNTTELILQGLRTVDISLASAEVPTSNQDIVSYGLGYLSILQLNNQNVFVSADYFCKGILDAGLQNDPDFTNDEMYDFFTTYQTDIENGAGLSANANRIYTSAEAEKLAPANEISEQFSYSYGYLSTMQLASELSISPEFFVNGSLDGAFGEDTIISSDTIQAAFEELQEQLDTQTAEVSTNNAKEAEDFLANNATVDGVITTDSGLQYKVIKAGEGDYPTAESTVTLDYELTNLAGDVLDSSIARGEKATFALTSVVPGFAEAVELMTPGETITAWLPPALAYGEAGNQAVEPNQLLIFNIALYSFE